MYRLFVPSPDNHCRRTVYNTDSCSDADLARLLDGVDCVIHAAGADGRLSGKAPVIDLYRRSNVLLQLWGRHSHPVSGLRVLDPQTTMVSFGID